jgi:hypothetical protein
VHDNVLHFTPAHINGASNSSMAPEDLIIFKLIPKSGISNNSILFNTGCLFKAGQINDTSTEKLMHLAHVAGYDAILPSIERPTGGSD